MIETVQQHFPLVIANGQITCSQKPRKSTRDEIKTRWKNNESKKKTDRHRQKEEEKKSKTRQHTPSSVPDDGVKAQHWTNDSGVWPVGQLANTV